MIDTIRAIINKILDFLDKFLKKKAKQVEEAQAEQHAEVKELEKELDEIVTNRENPYETKIIADDGGLNFDDWNSNK